MKRSKIHDDHKGLSSDLARTQTNQKDICPITLPMELIIAI